jgi:hypothetical protein
MDVGRLLLIGINVCTEVVDPVIPLNELASGRPLITYLPDGFPISRHNVLKFHGPIPEPWVQSIRSISVGSFCCVDSYTAWWSIAELKPDILSEILVEDGAFTHALDTLHDCTFGGTCRKNIDTRMGDSSLAKYPYILYVEPRQPLFPRGTDDEVQEAIGQLYTLLGRADGWIAPHNLFGALLTRGAGWAKPHEKIIALNSRPYTQQFSECLGLPATVIDVARHIAFIRMLRDMLDRLKSVKFLRCDADEYLKTFRDTDLLPAYEHGFLKDREHSIAERLRVMETVKQIERGYEGSWISRAEQMKENPSVPTLSSTPSVDLVQLLVHELHDRVGAIQCASELIVGRETAISDYLRDATTGVSNRINLKLQRSMRWLTWISVIIALIALLIGLWPRS